MLRGRREVCASELVGRLGSRGGSSTSTCVGISCSVRAARAVGHPDEKDFDALGDALREAGLVA